MRAFFQGSWSFGLVAALALGCGYEVYTDETEGCPSGSAGCPCAEGSGCEEALVCLEGVCGPGEGGSTTSSASTSSTGAGSTGSSSSTSTDASTGASACSHDDDDEESSPGTTGPCEFICEQDQPTGGELCDVWSQDCCVGHKCAAYDYDGDGAWDSTRCVPVIGDGQHGDPCQSSGVGDDCELGATCFYLDEDGAGTCVELCTGTSDSPSCAPPFSYCETISDAPFNLCIDSCDALAQDCPEGELCIGDPNSDGFVCVVDNSGGMAPEGTPCEFANVCNPGLVCVNAGFYPSPACEGADYCCAPFCDTGDPEACVGVSVPGADCVSYYAPYPAPEGYEQIGVCGVPG